LADIEKISAKVPLRIFQGAVKAQTYWDGFDKGPWNLK